SRDQRSYGFWSALWMTECWRVAKVGAPVCIFSDWRQLPTTTDAVQAGGWIWRGGAGWDKTAQSRPGKGRFRNQREYVLVGSKGAMALNRDAPVLPGCFRHAARAGERRHVAAKPESVMRELVRICLAGGRYAATIFSLANSRLSRKVSDGVFP